MATVSELQVRISADTRDAEQGLQRVNSAVRDTASGGGILQSAFGGISGVLAGVGRAALVSVASIGAMVGGLGVLGIVANASAEQTATAFTTLLGSGEKAKAFLDELRAFAASTPFEFPELADASRKLLAFGFAAEDIIPMMTSIGDAVGALGGGQAEINRVTMALGQMQAKGKVSAEEMMQLAELGIPAWKILADQLGVTTAEAMKLAEKGLIPASTAIPALVAGMEKAFGGSMQAQATTFNGLLSTLKDNAGMALQAFAGPLFEQAKSALTALGQAVADPRFQAFAAQVGSWLGSVITPVINGFVGLINAIMNASSVSQFFVDALNSILPGLGTFAQQAYAYGANIAAQFAAGIESAVSYIVGVLSYIGEIISYWLAPGSPPKIVPDLDKYGADAATVYFDGWREGDYSALNEIGSTVQEVLTGLVSAGAFQQQDVIPRVLGTQGALQTAINQLRETGTVSEDLINAIVDGAGPAGETIRGFVTAYFDLESATRAVKDAQDELNRVQDEYNAKLAPLNAELKAIQDKKRALQDQQRLEQLNKKVAEGNMTATEKAIALAEIEEIQKRQQIDAVNKEKDAAVDAAQQKLDAAKTQEKAAQDNLKTQQAAIAAFNRQNQLIGQQAQLLERIAKANAGGAKGGGGGLPKPALGKPAMPQMPKLDTKPLQDVSNTFNNVGNSLNALQTKVSPIFSALSAGFTIVGNIIQQITPYVVGFAAAFASFSILSSVAGWIGGLVATIGTFTAAIGTSGSILGGIIAILGGPVTATIVAVAAAIGLFAAAWAGNWGNIQGVMSGVTSSIMPVIEGLKQNLAAFIQNIQPGWQSLMQALSGAAPIFAYIAAIIGGVLVSAVAGLGAMLPGLGMVFSGVLEVISGVINVVSSLIIGLVSVVANLIKGDWSAAWQAAVDMVSGIGSGLVQILVGVGEGVIGIIKGLVQGVITYFTTLYNTLIGHSIIPDMVSGIIQAISTLPGQVLGFIITLVSGAISKFGELLTALTTLAANIVNAAMSVGKNIVDGIKNGIANGWEALKGWVAQKATSLLDAAKAALGISSPSKEFADNVGTPIMQGIAVGIQNSAPLAISAVKNVSAKILKEAFDMQAAFIRAKASAISGLQDIAPDSKKLNNLNNDIAKLQKKIDKGDKSEATQQKLLVRLQARAALLANITSAQEQLNAAEQEANNLRQIDGKLANDYYNMRVSQIMELAKLEKEKQDAKTQADRDRIQVQIELLKTAQDAELEAFKQSIEEAKDELKRNVQETINDIADRVNQFMRESLSGIAGFARGRASARRAIQDMLPDPSKLQDIKDNLKELVDEQARLEITAKQNIDPEKREEAEARLREIAEERRKLEEELTREQAQQTLQGEIARKAQEELAKAEREAMALREKDPQLADDYYNLKSQQILELAKLEQDKANAKTDEERNAIDEQIALVKEAQDAELKLFQDDAKKRADEINKLSNDMQDAASQFGKALMLAIQDAISALQGGFGDFKKSTPNGPWFDPHQSPGIPSSDARGKLITASQPTLSTTNTGGTVTNNYYTIDARGSQMTESQLRKVVEDTISVSAKNAAARDRTR